MKLHYFLNNPRGEQRKFDLSRNIQKRKETNFDYKNYEFQKNRLNISLEKFNKNRRERKLKKIFPEICSIEYIKIQFFVVFNDNELKTETRFKTEFGLVPVTFFDFNQTVLFAIYDKLKFKYFLKLLKEFINSDKEISPKTSPYNIVTLISDFEFLTTSKIILGKPDKDVIFSLVKKDESISYDYQEILFELKKHIKTLKSEYGEILVSSDDISSFEIKNIQFKDVKSIVDNFDIIYKVQSLRYPTIKSDKFNQPYLSWDIQIEPSTNDVKIGILDTGVRNIEPLNKIIENLNLDITNKQNPNPLKTDNCHGTSVAALAAVGIKLYNLNIKNFISDATIVPIKILNDNSGYFNIYDIESVIKSAIRNGVKIFNLSISGPTKSYNETISEYAYLLDRLSYENDILIFIAAGNLPTEDVAEMQKEIKNGKYKNFHQYPYHFYNPFMSSESHSCEATNICMPGESFNNITVGAIADNLSNIDSVELTPLRELPAFYTKKHFLDYTKIVNGVEVKKSQINYNINKPDIVMPGGDLMSESAAMQVLGHGVNGDDFFYKSSGTSLATPLASNLAARILGLYPNLNMQSVKALIINSAQKPLDESFLNDLILSLKIEFAKRKFKKDFDDLNINEKKLINEKINSKDLYHRLVGYGLPDINNALYSNSNSVTLLIQDSVSINSHKVVNLTLPSYLKSYSKKNHIIELKATLCFKFPPVWGNNLGYNPLHISFNFVRSVEKNNPIRIAEIVSNRDDKFYDTYTKELSDIVEISKAKKEVLGIKKSLESWSEDFFPASVKPFSNTQQMILKISAEELNKIDDQISIVVRCTFKKGVDKNVEKSLLTSSHQFSIALNITERKTNELKSYVLYDELAKCNDLELVSSIEIESDEISIDFN